MLRRIGLCLVALGLTHTGVCAQSLPVPSTWVNQRGSTLAITTMDASGSFTGTYVNRAPGFGCQNSPYPLAGTNAGDSVNFVVTWNNQSAWDKPSNCLSVSAWQGSLRGNAISTRWQLARGNPQTGEIQTSSGEDTFTRQ